METNVDPLVQRTESSTLTVGLRADTVITDQRRRATVVPGHHVYTLSPPAATVQHVDDAVRSYHAGSLGKLLRGVATQTPVSQPGADSLAPPPPSAASSNASRPPPRKATPHTSPTCASNATC